VYEGGNLGLMGGVSIAAFLGGSQVLGVVSKALAKGDIIGKTIGEVL
jgi:predicted Rossmann-fold nucleotide-binding protein